MRTRRISTTECRNLCYHSAKSPVLSFSRRRRARRKKRGQASFLPGHFPLPIHSVTIRGVSTKLKVNSGRTTPPGQPSPRKPLPKKRDRPPRWFPGKPCVNTAFESKAKGVAKLTYSDRTNLQIDQDLHPGPRTFALDVLPALLSTYLPAQARQLSALQTGCFVPVGFFVRPTVVDVTGTF